MSFFHSPIKYQHFFCVILSFSECDILIRMVTNETNEHNYKYNQVVIIDWSSVEY